MTTNPDDPIEHGKFFRFEEGSCGLTKREYFAAAIISGIVADNNNLVKIAERKVQSDESLPSAVCSRAIVLADALIEELNKES